MEADDKLTSAAVFRVIGRFSMGCFLLFFIPIALILLLSIHPHEKVQWWQVPSITEKVIGSDLDEVEQKYGPSASATEEFPGWDRCYYLCNSPVPVSSWYLVIRLNDDGIVIASDAVEVIW